MNLSSSVKKLTERFYIGLAATVTVSQLGLGPMAAKAIGFGSSLTSQAVVSVAISTLSSQAAVGMVTHQGNVGHVLKDLTSTASLRNLATEMAVAALAGSGPSGQQLSLAKHLGVQATRSVVRAGCEIAVKGEKLSDALKQALKSTAVNALGASVAGEIGQAYGTHELNYLTHKLSHGLLGGATGALLAKDSAKGAISGAIGGIVSEVTVEMLTQDLNALRADAFKETRQRALEEGRVLSEKEFLHAYEHKLRARTDVARLAAGIVACGTGQEVGIALATATTAVENNAWQLLLAAPEAIAATKVAWEIYSLTHEEELQMTKEEICRYVEGKTGIDQKVVETTYDGLMLALSTGNAIKQGGKAVFKKMIKSGVNAGVILLAINIKLVFSVIFILITF